MKVCKLCQKLEANQTGSHILSWFLIRDAVNQKGKRRRHNEVSFEISSASFVNTYFGSEVLPDTIEITKGRELTDDEIDQQKNHYTEDFILCTTCEDRLGTLENYISVQVFDRLRTFVLGGDKIYVPINFSEKEALRIFIYSLIWRSSIVGFNHLKLLVDEEEKLRLILDNSLHLNEKEMLQNLRKDTIRICEMPLVIAFFETIGENTNSIFSFKSKKPYSMIINDMSFQLFFKLKDSKRTDEYFFGINSIIPRNEFINHKEDEFKVAFISDKKRKVVYGKLYSFIADKMMRSAVSMFRYAFHRIFKKRAPQGIVEYFRAKAFLNSDDKIEKYTPEYFRKIMAEVMHEYVGLLRRSFK